MLTNAQTVSQKILFNDLCNVFQEIKSTYPATKHSVFTKFLRRWRDEMIKETSNNGGFCEYRTDDTFYPALRLFAPSKDVKTREFRIKEAKLNHLVCKAIVTTPLNPVPTNKELLVERLVNMASDLFPANMTKINIYEVNDFLDRIKYPNNAVVQEEAMVGLCSQCTPKELRWLFHIILGNIENCLGVPAHTIMRTFHPEADNLWKEGDSLQTICEKFADPETQNSLNLTGHLLCKPFRPMLLKRLNYNKYCIPKIIRFCRRPFYVETKYDGEHLLVHKYERTNYKYFTRNGVDYTHKLGRNCQILFSKKIHKFFKDEVRDCVLDCELLIWDNVLKCFVGKNRRASDGNVYDPKHLDDEFFENHSMFERSIAVFDILYINGKCLLNEKLVLSERVEVLKNILNEEDFSTIFISKKQLINKVEDFVNFYKNSMSQNEEGIVVKSTTSLYYTGSRAEKNGWFKIKPDYGIQSVLDLAVVGVRILEGEEQNRLKSFLVAARVCNSSDNENDQATSSRGINQIKFKMIAGITSRLKALDFQCLRSSIGNTCNLLTNKPEWLEFEDSKHASHNYRFLQYEKIQIVQVRASGLINGKLQFPAIVAIRDDKLIEEIDTVDDIIHFDERLRSRPMIDEDDDDNILLNKKRRQQLNLKESSRLLSPREIENAERFSNKLEGCKVCVLNANEGFTTQQFQKILIELGATVVANASNSTTFCVAQNPETFVCVCHIKADKRHIVHGDWLLRCKEEKKLLPWNNSDMIHISQNSKFDLFSIEDDILTELKEKNINKKQQELQPKIFKNIIPIKRKQQKENTSSGPSKKYLKEKDSSKDMEENNSYFERLAEEAEQEERQISQELLNQLSSTDCQPIEKGNLFADFVFFLHSSLHYKGQVNNIRQLIEAQNGKIIDKLESSVTHVVIDKLRSGEEQTLFDFNEKQQYLCQFVNIEWIKKTIEEEDRYLFTC